MKFYALLVICVAAAPAAAGPFVKIAGGHEATQGQFPWLVSVELTNTQDRWHLCDGVLVGSQWVLTTAHCLDHEDPAWLTVVSGEHRKDVLEGTEQIHKVDYFVKHPSYIFYQQPFVNDVGLVHLSYPVTFDAFTNLAPISGSLSPMGSCIEAGWGETSVSGGMSNILQYTTVPVLPLSDCEAAYSSPHDPKAVCAGSLNGGVGFCVGDTGGGLFCFNPLANRYEVSAILSWREGCAQPGKPGVYMNVASYWDWISSMIT